LVGVRFRHRTALSSVSFSLEASSIALRYPTINFKYLYSYLDVLGRQEEENTEISANLAGIGGNRRKINQFLALF